MSRRESDCPRVVARPPLIYLAFLALGLGLDYVRPAPVFPKSVSGSVQNSAAAVLIILGLGIIAVAVWQFRRAGTNVPTNKPTLAIITHGLYRFSRNPIYIALSLIYAGIGVAVDSLWVVGLLLPIVVIVRYGVIAREERYLEQKFGNDYRRYKVSVRRWL